MRSYRICVFSSDLLYLALRVHPHCYKWQDFLLFFLMDKIIFHCTYILGWPKVSFWYFHKMIWKNLSKPFGHPNTLFFLACVWGFSLVVAQGLSLWRGGLSCFRAKAVEHTPSVVASLVSLGMCISWRGIKLASLPWSACSYPLGQGSPTPSSALLLLLDF